VRTGQSELANRLLLPLAAPMLGSFWHGSTNGQKNRRIFGCAIVAQWPPNKGVLHQSRASHPNVTCWFRTTACGIGNLLNRCNGENCSEVSSNAPQDVGMHSKETKKTAKKGRGYRPWQCGILTNDRAACSVQSKDVVNRTQYRYNCTWNGYTGPFAIESPLRPKPKVDPCPALWPRW